jgi:teichuronic acid biosynthesis glycosyltransferase TuaH
MHDLLFISLESWDEIWRRNQFLCAGISKRFPSAKILFVEPPRDISNHLRRGSLEPLYQQATQNPEGFPNITLFRPLKFWPNSLHSGRRWNERQAKRQIKQQMRALGITSPLLWINSHDSANLAGQMDERAVIYDITDDWTQFGSPRERKVTIAQDAALCRRADLTIVCSQALYDSRKNRCREILHLPNGVQLEHYQNLAQHRAKAPQYPGPVFGYTGTLHPERVDATLLEALAKAYPTGSVVLVGPNHFDAATREKLTNLKNVHFTGGVPYSQIPHYMAAFDVCIVPHLETPFTQSLNPLKLWEYLASGKPVASTNVAGFQDYAQLCHIGSGTEGFLNACRFALEETQDQQRAAQRQAATAGHSWDARLDTLLTALEKWNS